jgi:hypothetical protein
MELKGVAANAGKDKLKMLNPVSIYGDAPCRLPGRWQVLLPWHPGSP